MSKKQQNIFSFIVRVPCLQLICLITLACFFSPVSLTEINAQNAKPQNSVRAIFNLLRNDIQQARGKSVQDIRAKTPASTKPIVAIVKGPLPRKRPFAEELTVASIPQTALPPLNEPAQPLPPVANIVPQTPLVRPEAPYNKNAKRSTAIVEAPAQINVNVVSVSTEKVAPSPKQIVSAPTKLQQQNTSTQIVPKTIRPARTSPLILATLSTSARNSKCPARKMIGISGLYAPHKVSLKPKANVQKNVGIATAKWLETIVQPAAQRYLGSDVVRLRIAASFACRTRNNQPGAEISEHGFGNAIDISSFILADGRSIHVAGGWRGRLRVRNFLRAAHNGACAHFTTVLGPNADKYHQDHFHLDLAKRNSSSYCR